MDLCVDCLHDLPWLSGSHCRRCALPLAARGSYLCGHCLRRPPPQSLSLAAFHYEFPLPEWIAALKFNGRQPCARVLGELLAIRIREALAEQLLELPDVLVPVPLHPLRRLRRGFNQAELIAWHVGHDTGVPVAGTLARRLRNTPPQSGLSRTARMRNLRHCFAVSPAAAGVRIAIVDDVMTTGSTVAAFAAELCAAGAADVQVWAIARA